MNVLKRLWRDEAGVTYTIEIILVATVVSLGLIVGMSALRDSVNNELADVGSAIDELNQTYVIDSIRGHSAGVSASNHIDDTDYCDLEDDASATQAEGCITLNAGAGANEGTGQASTAPTGT